MATIDVKLRGKPPAPWRKPSVPEWFPFVNENTIAFTKEHEWPIPHLYKDTKGLITTGIGFNVDDNPKKAYDLGMYWADGQKAGIKKASVQEIAEAYKKIKPMENGRYFDYYDPFKPENSHLSKIIMRNEDMEFHVREKLKQSERELKHKIPKFNEFPYSARLALLDMQYNMGDKKFRERFIDKDGKEKGWPNLYRAIDLRDWKKAANESKRDVGDSRNKAIYDLFLDADRFERRRD